MKRGRRRRRRGGREEERREEEERGREKEERREEDGRDLHAVTSLNLFLDMFWGSLLAMHSIPGFFLYRRCKDK